MMKFIFGMQINIEVFYKLILPFWMCVTRHAQSTQNSKLTISLIYLKENAKDEVDFFCLQVNDKVFFKLVLAF